MCVLHTSKDQRRLIEEPKFSIYCSFVVREQLYKRRGWIHMGGQLNTTTTTLHTTQIMSELLVVLHQAENKSKQSDQLRARC
jgi:hypothetical protein